MTDLACVECGHGWGSHHEYDDELDRYVGRPCDHWSGCGCKLFVEPPKPVINPTTGWDNEY